ncbi:MAG: hypothetical protein JKY61_10060, partial [Planctomycetes bacterium]|nr:hypothetical protein [Planctomycetota bacterium]
MIHGRTLPWVSGVIFRGPTHLPNRFIPAHIQQVPSGAFRAGHEGRGDRTPLDLDRQFAGEVPTGRAPKQDPAFAFQVDAYAAWQAIGCQFTAGVDHDTAQQALLHGIDTVANAVKLTLGPKGRNVVLEKKWGAPVITNDGVTIAKEID